LTEVGECFKKKLLIRTKPNKELAAKSIRQAKHFLKKTERYLKLKDAETVSIYLYYALFHAGRALLFKDGIKERSHFCTLLYLEFTYVKRGLLPEEYLDTLRALKENRQEIQYGFLIESNIDLDTLEDYFEKAKSFINLIENIL